MGLINSSRRSWTLILRCLRVGFQYTEINIEKHLQYSLQVLKNLQNIEESIKVFTQNKCLVRIKGKIYITLKEN